MCPPSPYVANVFDVTHAVVGLPQDEGPDGVALHDGIEQRRSLLYRPYEIALELRDLDDAPLDIIDEIVVLSAIGLGLRARGRHR